MGYMRGAQYYSTLVNAREMTMSEAAELLSTESNGGLTVLGAADVLADPIAAGLKLANLGDEARSALDRFRGMGD